MRVRSRYYATTNRISAPPFLREDMRTLQAENQSVTICEHVTATVATGTN